MMRETEGDSMRHTKECSQKVADPAELLRHPVVIYVKEERESDCEAEEAEVGCDPLHLDREQEYLQQEGVADVLGSSVVKEEEELTDGEDAEFGRDGSRSSRFHHNHDEDSGAGKMEGDGSDGGTDPSYFYNNTCPNGFTPKSATADHSQMHTDGEVETHVCGLCGEAFQAASHLRHHCHNCPERQLAPVPGHLSAPRMGGGGGKQVAMEKGGGKSKRYACEVCGAAFAYRSCLEVHMRHHTNERPFECDVCGGTFKRSDQLRTHMRLHSGLKPYACEVCGRTFALAGNLRVHARRHTGERPYSCDVCGKTFRQAVCLKRHTRLHTGERPYRCSTCGRCFNQTSSLKAHSMLHSGEKPYVCTVCERTFRRASHLRYHSRTHASTTAKSGPGPKKVKQEVEVVQEEK